MFRRRSQHADPDKVQARYEKGCLPITIAAGAASASA
ncbi:Hsp20/alpha crystallin family protein [Burkholderia ubonensis]|nr:Hsp20/alpha crystallin family protein [Burkholderia ubonensis]RQP86889.1 Hsp20/alpha crystallin family protein [Burkholderia ubonensis]RQQ15455.1 Hsp20/alpha crystallin family protein [Burkholderia ubonensis]